MRHTTRLRPLQPGPVTPAVVIKSVLVTLGAVAVFFALSLAFLLWVYE